MRTRAHKSRLSVRITRAIRDCRAVAYEATLLILELIGLAWVLVRFMR